MEKSGSSEGTQQPKKLVKVWVDGCFDMMHFGHANALRQAKALGDYLIVGVHSDAEVLKNKGPPVMKEEERYAQVAACKWVDEVVPDAPYITQLEVMDQHDADFVVHGDDVTTAADGSDCYAKAKAVGRYQEVARTTGVSTTDIVKRMLECTKEHYVVDAGSILEGSPMVPSMSEGTNKGSPPTGIAKFIATSQKISKFSNGKEPKPTDKVVYIDGAWDLFHVGHLKILEKAKALGNFLIVGVLDDLVVNRYKKANFPIMNLYERVLSVLSCKYVDEVVIAAPEKITKEFIDGLNIQCVVHGKDPVEPCEDGSDPYEVAKQLGLYKEIDSGSDMTTTVIINRIKENRMMYEERNKRKEVKGEEEKRVLSQQGEATSS
ncbi:choline phosphate cytidylyltransferase [Balamuthia mandrillaris]